MGAISRQVSNPLLQKQQAPAWVQTLPHPTLVVDTGRGTWQPGTG